MGRYDENKDEFGYYRSDPVAERKLRRNGRYYRFIRRCIEAILGKESARSTARQPASIREPLDGAGLTGEDLAVLQNRAANKGIEALVASAEGYPAARAIQCEVCGRPAQIVVDDLVALASVDPTIDADVVRQPHYFCVEHIRESRVIIITDVDDYA